MSRSSLSGRVLALLALPTLVACASFRSRKSAPSPAEIHYGSAVAALDSADFVSARADLTWLVGRCEAGSRGARALLLLASAELDARNPDRSPHRAAQLAARYLELPGAAGDDLPVAQSLYLLALDLGGSPGAPSPRADADSSQVTLPPLAPRFQRCDDSVTVVDSASLPAYPGTTVARRMAELQRLLQERTDSLRVARAGMAARDRKIEELQAEIERIRKLLKGGGGVPPDTTRS